MTPQTLRLIAGEVGIALLQNADVDDVLTHAGRDLNQEQVREVLAYLHIADVLA